MFIAYETLFELNDGKLGATLRACNSGTQVGIMVSLDTKNFHVDYHAGQAEVCLVRRLTNEQARELAAQLVRAADVNEKLERECSALTGGDG